MLVKLASPNKYLDVVLDQIFMEILCCQFLQKTPPGKKFML